MLAQVEKCDSRRELVGRQRLARLGQQDLTTVGQIEQPGEAVHRRAEVVALTLLGRSDVNGHPHRQRAGCPARLGQQAGLADAVSGVLDQVAALLLDGRSLQLVVAGERRSHV